VQSRTGAADAKILDVLPFDLEQIPDGNPPSSTDQLHATDLFRRLAAQTLGNQHRHVHGARRLLDEGEGQRNHPRISRR
jgi:hypothetical protein